MLSAERPAHQPARVEPRPRLEPRLRRGLEQPLLVVAAAPGYGKTVTLARLAALDARPAVWCRDVASITMAISHTAEPRLLLVDDVDQFALAERESSLALLTGELPAGWCAAISTSRALEEPHIWQAFAHGNAAYFDETDLALDRRDADALGCGDDQSGQAVQAAWQRAEGWPFGIITLLQGREHWLADYFTTRILDSLSPRCRRFLEAILVLPSFDAEACLAASRFPDSADLLHQLVRNHAFLRRLDADRFAFLPLFRSVLLGTLRHRRPRAVLRSAERAAEHLVQRGDPTTALQVLTECGATSTGVAVFRRIAPGAIAERRSADLKRWITLFPDQEQQHDPWLLHYRGVELRLRGAYVRAWQRQEQARVAFRAANVRDGEAFATAELGTLACLRRRPAEAEQLLEQARRALGDSGEVHHASVLCALADAYVALNRLREATRVGEEAVALTSAVVGSQVPSAHAKALQGLATVRLREGEFGQALEIVKRALDFGREHHLDVETSTRTMFLLGCVRWGTGDLELADEVLSSAAAIAARHDLVGLQASIDGARAGVLTDLGRLDEADHFFSRGAPPSDSYLTDTRATFGWLRVLQNRLTEARAVFRETLEDSSLLSSAAEVGRAKACLGVIAMQLNQLEQAEQWLLDSARGFEESGARYRLAGAHLHLADLYNALGRQARSRRYLRLAIDYAAEAESYDFFLWHPATVARLAVIALREGIHTEYVEALCRRRLGATEVSRFLPLLSRAEPTLQPIGRRIVDALLAREPSISVAGLDQCSDDFARLRLTRAIVEGCLTPRGLIVLRHQYHLTWAESDVFVAYYLTDLDAIAESNEPERRSLARKLSISENTLRHHITSIRQKLGLGVARGSATVFVWALTTGIATWPPGQSSSTLPHDRWHSMIVP